MEILQRNSTKVDEHVPPGGPPEGSFFFVELKRGMLVVLRRKSSYTAKGMYFAPQTHHPIPHVLSSIDPGNVLHENASRNFAVKREKDETEVLFELSSNKERRVCDLAIRITNHIPYLIHNPYHIPSVF